MFFVHGRKVKLTFFRVEVESVFLQFGFQQSEAISA